MIHVASLALSIHAVLILMDIHGYSVVISKPPNHLLVFKDVVLHRSDCISQTHWVAVSLSLHLDFVVDFAEFD